MAVKTPILIFCRIKPNIIPEGFHSEFQEYTVNTGEGSDNDTLVIYNYQNVNFVNHKPDSYSFQFVKVFDQEAGQEQIYNAVAKPVVESALSGYNGTIFAYGQTGSGKTHTISGDRDNPGVVPRALQDIFTAITNAEGETFDVHMSYLEIYNEQSNDLLLSTGEEKKKISLRESGDRVLEWHNLSMTPVRNYEDALELLITGDNNRIVGDTPMNIYSSRSHTILTIYLTARVHDSLEVRRAKLNLVDLAGSERVHKTGEEGIVLEEARHINLSLHYLEQVIVALSHPSRSHVPYRNCTLTAALRDSLGGNCMTVMVANITMDKANIEETISTCRFAQRVSLVRNELSVNTERDLSGENSQLRAEIQQLKGQCSSLRAKVKELEKRHGGKRMSYENSVDSHSTDSDYMYSHHLKTDIIYMIDWLQELKGKQSNTPTIKNDSSISNFSILSSVEPDEGFEDFVGSIGAKEDWSKARESEKVAADALSTQLTAIDTVHQEILNWWKQNEKSLVRKMLSGRVINVPGGEVTAVDDPDATTAGDVSIDLLLHKHSDLLKDFQLLKSRLQSSKRNLQRVKRKYLVEFNNWKKGKVSFESILEQMGGTGDAMECENEKADVFEDEVTKNQDVKNEVNSKEEKNPKNVERETSYYSNMEDKGEKYLHDIESKPSKISKMDGKEEKYSHDFESKNSNMDVKGEKYSYDFGGKNSIYSKIDGKGEKYPHDFESKYSIYSNMDGKGEKCSHDFENKSLNHPNRYWNYEKFRSDHSLLMDESDFSSVLNNSTFSTSTLLSESRVSLSESRGCKQPRLVRSVPTALHSSFSAANTTSLRLTGDHEIDEEIIAFYRSKRVAQC